MKKPEFDFSKLDAILAAAAPAVAPAIVCRIEQCFEYRPPLLLFERAYGTIEPEAAASAPVQVDSIFDLASVTKLFVLTTFLKLADQGFVQK